MPHSRRSRRSSATEISSFRTLEVAGEFAFLNLRLTKGLNLEEYKERFSIDLQIKYADDLKHLEEAELIEFENNHLKLTKKGMVYSNEVFAVFI